MSEATSNTSQFDINDVRLKIIRQTLLCIVVLGLPALILSMLRLNQAEFINIIIIHTSFYITNVVVFFTQHKIRQNYVTWFLLVEICFLGMGALTTIGLIGSGLFILTVCSLLSALLLSNKTGYLVTILLSLSIAITAVLTQQKIISPDINLNIYNVELTSWFLSILVFCLFSIIIINGYNSIESFLKLAIYRLSSHEKELKEIVEQRTSMMQKAVDDLDGVLNAATQVAIIATDTNGIVTLFNSGAEALLGYSASEVVGQKSPALWHDSKEIEERGKFLSNQLGHTVSGFDVFIIGAKSSVYEELEWTFHQKSGERIRASLGVSAIKNSQGEITGYLGCATDVTDKYYMTKVLEDNETRLRTMVENAPGITYRCAIDELWTMSFISPAIKELAGYDANEFIDNYKRSFASIIHEDDLAFVSQQIESAISANEPFNIEYRVLDKYGEIHWVSERGQGVENQTDGHQWIDGIIIDITEQKRILEELKASQARYSALIENIANIIIRLDINGKIEFINQQIYHYGDRPIIGLHIVDLVQQEHKLALENSINQAKEEGCKQVIDVQLTEQGGELEWYQLIIAPIVEQQAVVGLTLVATNINQRIEREDYIRHLALHDHLTGLPNRRLFDEKLDFYIKQSARTGGKFSLLALDLDDFKPINDQYGHDFGDQLLKKLALRLDKCIRESDIVARLGGDEFAIVLTAIHRVDDINKVCQQVIERINQKFTINDITVSVGVSIGVASFPFDATDPHLLAKQADNALYLAKSSGRNTVCFAESYKSSK